ncbi:MAG: TIGR04283 family arsenosugar biosynthesis glycosyltransferase [Flavobacteriales bacterium]|nr:TIGR04283 family arsenosugar biosynthesis glycosyltransferase [Flavobacteriales bacterium]
MVSLSIIIPTLNESENLEKLLNYLLDNTTESTEIIVVDGGSSDNSVEIVQQLKVKVETSDKGRAKQMNKGALVSKGKRLYFLHADTIPPQNFENLIFETISVAGCFRMKFDKDHWLLNFYSWFTRFNWRVCRGGDRSLFINKSLFEDLNGFKDIPLMEDYDIVNRIVADHSFLVMENNLISSARMYEKYGILRLQLIYVYVHLLWFFGEDELELQLKLKNLLD